jgi:putative ABC transport system ATP-binding protein
VSHRLCARALCTSFADAGGAQITALTGVTAEFLPGELSVIVGPSGSGKTTLLHALAGIIVPQEGRVSFGGLDVSTCLERERDAWRLSHCGMVFQDFRLIDELDALANTLLPVQFMHLRIPTALRSRGAELLAQFGLPPRSGPVARLSRGEQQRVALARALLLDPPVLLADEPTASLDAVNGERIADALVSVARAGKIVIAVTHDEKLSARADRRLNMKAGRLVAAVAVSG